MHTEIKLHQVSGDKLLAIYVERRLTFALSRFGERIGRITTRITAPSGARPGELHCRITAELHPFGAVTAEAIDADVYTAIDRCVGRLARQCQNKCSRMRSRRLERSSIRLGHSPAA